MTNTKDQNALLLLDKAIAFARTELAILESNNYDELDLIIAKRTLIMEQAFAEKKTKDTRLYQERLKILQSLQDELNSSANCEFSATQKALQKRNLVTRASKSYFGKKEKIAPKMFIQIS